MMLLRSNPANPLRSNMYIRLQLQCFPCRGRFELLMVSQIWLLLSQTVLEQCYFSYYHRSVRKSVIENIHLYNNERQTGILSIYGSHQCARGHLGMEPSIFCGR